EERDLLAGELDEGGLPGWEVNEVGDLGGLGHGERSFGCKDSGLPRWLAAKPRPSDGYQRPPPPPPPRPERGLSCASFTLRLRPSSSLPSSAAMAALASASEPIVTNAKPRGRPVSRSLGMATSRTVRPF